MPCMTAKTKTLLAPNIHLNGTGEADLLEALETAYSSVGDAMDSLKACAPNGRDYYTISPAAYGEAEDQHVARMRAMHQVRTELEAMILGVLDRKTQVEVDC